MSPRTKQILSGVLMANGVLVLLMSLTLLVARIGASKSYPDYQYTGVFPPSQGNGLAIFATSEQELAFDVISQPKDPEVIGHFVLHKGQFLLQDNGDGTTTVTGTSWYTLNPFPDPLQNPCNKRRNRTSNVA